MASWILSLLLSITGGGSADCTLVYFTAAWCEPCKQVRPALEQLQREGWSVQSIDADQHPQLLQQFRVENLPTIVILCRNQEVDRMVGAAPYERIQERIKRAAARNESGQARAPSNSLPQQSSVNQPIVRGQSPAMAAFPMLSTIGTVSDVAHDSGQRPAAAPPTSFEPQVQPQSSSNPVSAPISVEQAIARAAAATVRIRVDEANTTAFGTGTIVDVRGQEALILTCGHLFRDMQPNSQLTIDLFPGTAQEVNLPSELIDFKAEGEDIGLISFRVPVPVAPVPILARGEPLAVGNPAFSFGCDHGQNPTRRDTRIKNINRYIGADNIEIMGAPAVGRSGGGLFDLQGRLIGVCNAANVEDDEGIYAAAEVVYTQIERLGLAELFNGGTTPAAAATTQLASAPKAPTSAGWQAGQAQTATAQTEPLQWPDSAASAPADPLEKVSAAPGQSANVSAQQLICIVRDANGEDKVVTIEAPPAQLLQMIQQSMR